MSTNPEKSLSPHVTSPKCLKSRKKSKSTRYKSKCGKKTLPQRGGGEKNASRVPIRLLPL